MRPVTVIAPSGTIVAAEFPAAVGAGNVEVSQRVADVCLGALAQAAPDRVGAAGQGTMNNVLLGGAADPVPVSPVGVLRDHRRRTGRPARTARHERPRTKDPSAPGRASVTPR